MQTASSRLSRDFYPRPPRGGRPADSRCSMRSLRFLSTPSARRATVLILILPRLAADFYPRPPRGGRRAQQRPRPHRRYFYPRPPRGGRRGFATLEQTDRNFYPRPPRGGRHVDLEYREKVCEISIHALREEGDPWHRRTCWPKHISIHALREEGDSKNRDKISIFKQIIQHSARI